MRKAVVVIADDEPLARKALRGHLASLDWIGEVHEAGDGWSAIHAVDEVRPHILFQDVVMPGVVCIPYGWGHGLPGTRQSVAAGHAGVNVNVLTDASAIDPVSGNAVLNGIPVTVAAV